MFYRIPEPSNFTESVSANAAARATQQANAAATEVSHLREEMGRLALLNQALWELLQQRFGLTEDELVKLATEIDLRDGKADGKITAHPLRCPNCSRVSNSRHQKCLYCGQEFEGSLFGGLAR